MLLTEKINKNKADWISTLSKEAFFSYFPYSTSQLDKGEKRTLSKAVYFSLVKQYIQSHKSADYKGLDIRYNYSDNNTDGRMYSTSSLSLQRIHTPLRAFLTKGIYKDYDMTNAHPTILLDLFKQNNITHTYSQQYVDDRDYMLDGNSTKKEMLVLLNTDNAKFIKKKSVALHNLVLEWNAGKILLFEKFPRTQTNSKNPISSNVNKLICIIENEMLQKHAIKPAVLMFDGFMTETYIESFDTDIVKWTDKPILSNIEIPDDFDTSTIKDTILSPIEEKLRQYHLNKPAFELTHAKIISLNGGYIRLENDKIVILSTTEIMNCYKHMPHEFINFWMKDPDIRLYKYIDSYPNIPCPNDTYNTWTPFALDDCGQITDQFAVDIFLEHINVLCNYDKPVTNVIIHWLAHLIQYPQYKSFVPAFISGQGSGKGTLLKFIQVMLGTSKVLETTDPLRDVFGNFNSLMATCHLVCLNEINKNDTANVMGKFKGLATDPHLHINDKGKSPYEIKSYHKFIIFSNNEDPIRTEQGDRRLYIIKSSDDLAGNKEYFEQIHKLLDDVNAMKSIYSYLKNIPNIPTTFQVSDFPKVAYQEVLKEANRDYVDLWLQDFTERHATEPDVKLNNSESLADFKGFCAKTDIKCELNSIQFNKKLMLMSVDGIDNIRTNTSRHKCFDITKLKKRYMIGCMI
tara:strand:- start:236 stop:2293 length:2058 start_codon:yes stop_codon:yes gene_type:complete